MTELTVPAGTYSCVVAETVELNQPDGPRWLVRWVVESGPCAGQTAALDALGWNPRGISRTRLVLRALGFGERTPRHDELVGRRARVTVYPRARVNPKTGRKTVANRVAFAGVEPIGAGA